MTPKDDHALIIIRPCDHVILHGKGNFADVLKIKDLEMGRLAPIIGGPNLIAWVLEENLSCLLPEKQEEGSVRRKKPAIDEGPQVKKCRCPQKWEKVKK